MSEPGADDVVAAFHELYYGARERTWRNTYWLGHGAYKCPLDLWVYQEIVFETRPDVIVETGTASGGSALFLATMCDAVGNGSVLTIDVERRAGLPKHPRITYLHGSSVEPAIVARVEEAVRAAARVLVVLDSDHSLEHVLAELRTYAPLARVGDYVIVEDTNVNGNPVRPDFGPGPREAIDDFLAENNGFERDVAREKFFMTFNPGGWLVRCR
jgi:cephalosporin hydroxylase